MVWVAVALLVMVGVILILRRVEIARGQSIFFGGRMPVGCVVAQGILFLGLAAAFYMLYRAGVVGGK